MKDYQQEVTDQIVGLMEKGARPWARPWAESGPHRNASTNKPYSGLNPVILQATSMVRGFEDPRWLTFKQAKDMGHKVKKGAKSVCCHYYDKVLLKPKDGEEDDDARMVPILKTFNLFNAGEIDGLPSLRPGDWEPLRDDKAEGLIMSLAPVEVRHGGDRAYYSPSGDYVQMPPREMFRTVADYLGPLGHEFVHATGHPSRCARQFGKEFGDDAYAFEEFVAELGSAMLSSRTGLPMDLERNAAYISTWARMARADKRLVFKAASLAGKAVDWMLGERAEAKEGASDLPSEPFSTGESPRSPLDALALAGADANAMDRQGRNPLHACAARADNGALSDTVTLLANGANPDARDASGATPADIASRGSPALRVLIDAGSTVTRPAARSAPAQATLF